MHPFRSLPIAALVLVAAAAGSVRAADVPVTYTVDTTALKLAVSGTNLTFELHTNATCTALAHTQVLTIDNTNLQSVLKRSKPKNGVKPPKTTDIRATLTGVAPAAPLYAKVTGTGITPVGAACQVQAATAANASPSGHPVLKDANGAVLGTLDLSGYFIAAVGADVVAGFTPPTGFIQGVQFYYASANCAGPKLTNQFAFGSGLIPAMQGVDGTTLYYGPATAPLTSVSSSDFGPTLPAACVNPGQVFVPPDRCCCQSPTCFGPPAMYNAGPPATWDISGFVPPFSAGIQ